MKEGYTVGFLHKDLARYQIKPPPFIGIRYGYWGNFMDSYGRYVDLAKEKINKGELAKQTYEAMSKEVLGKKKKASSNFLKLKPL